MSEKVTPPTRIEKLSSRYGDMTPVRAIIQSIPYAGAALDTLLASSGQKWKTERVEHFLSVLEEKMAQVSEQPKISDLATNEEMYDLIHYILDQITKTRSCDKRRRFAGIVQKQIIEDLDWAEPESAAQLLAELSDIDLQVLVLIAEAPECGEPFGGLRIAFLDEETPRSDGISRESFHPLNLLEALPRLSNLAIRMACSRLAARGLIRDDGIGRFGGIPMRFFVANSSAYWFLEWAKN